MQKLKKKTIQVNGFIINEYRQKLIDKYGLPSFLKMTQGRECFIKIKLKKDVCKNKH